MFLSHSIGHIKSHSQTQSQNAGKNASMPQHNIKVLENYIVKGMATWIITDSNSLPHKQRVEEA